MTVDWILLRKDGSRLEEQTKETSVPVAGDGKVINGVGYAIKAVAHNLVSHPNTIAIAEEH